MKRFCVLAVLMLLGLPAHAGESFSFVFGGHHIHIETSRNCRSSSCVSVSIPGVYEKRARRDRYDDDDTRTTSPAQVASPAVTSPNPAPAQLSPPPVAPVVCTPPAAPARPVAPPVVAAVQPQIQPPSVQPVVVAAAPPPQPAPAIIAAASVSAPVAAPVAPPAIVHPAEAVVPSPPVIAPPKISKVVHREEPETDSPVGDWQTEGHKGMVRIEPCGKALCGYVLDPETNAKGETVLIDMKSKTTSEWSGNIYSRDSGNTYYATMTQKGPDQLQVEACALGRFFCSGNGWSRIAKSDRLITYREIPAKPQS